MRPTVRTRDANAGLVDVQKRQGSRPRREENLDSQVIPSVA
jgi:hypothetical protein